jgi:hypothetical protein
MFWIPRFYKLSDIFPLVYKVKHGDMSSCSNKSVRGVIARISFVDAVSAGCNTCW